VLVVAAGITPDLDGLGIVVDFATRQFGLAETDYYQSLHRLWGHGLVPALVIAALAAAGARSRHRVALCALLSVHLHFLCDILGSRGNGPEDIWPIWYFAPFSQAWPLSWSGQWPLVGWQNTLITAVLIAYSLHRATVVGHSPVGLFHPRADEAVIRTLRERKKRWPWRKDGAA
jgi:membrane-bound metal-dependent hydrolase YbcI (DUF457 family)